MAAIELDEGELIEIPPQSDVRHLREELLSESGTWAIERTDESSADHDRADGREHIR